MQHTYVYLHIWKARERKLWEMLLYVRDFLLTCILAPASSFCPHLNTLETCQKYCYCLSSITFIPANFSHDVLAGMGPGDFPPWVCLTLEDAADVCSWLVRPTSLLVTQPHAVLAEASKSLPQALPFPYIQCKNSLR